jgi:uncharacterized membrane protein
MRYLQKCRKMRLCGATCVGIHIFAIASPTQAAPLYDVIDLKTSTAVDLDDRGAVLVRQKLSTSNMTYRFSLIQNGKLKTLTTDTTYFSGLSDNGNLVGSWAGAKSSFVQKPDGARTMLQVASGAYKSRGLAVNNAGSVVGSATYSTGDSTALWQKGRASVYGFLGGTYATPVAINNADAFVAQVWLPNGKNGFSLRPIIHKNGLTTRLQLLGGSHATPTDINDNDVAVGYSQTSNGSQNEHGVIWSRGKFKDIGVLPGTNQSSLQAINNAGLAVGTSAIYGETYKSLASLWDGKKLLDLNTLLNSRAGVQLVDAIDINNAGQILARGTINGNVSSFLLNPLLQRDAAVVTSARLLSFSTVAQVPEPTGVLAGLMLAAGVLKRSRSE